MSNSLSDVHTHDYVRHVNNAGDAIDALGGTAAVSRLCETSMQVVSDWRRRGHFPPGYYLRISNALAEISCVAPLSVYQMKPAAPREDISDVESE